MVDFFALRIPHFIFKDIDECVEQNVCDNLASCTDMEGTYRCGCREGYTGNGTSCFGKKILLRYVLLRVLMKNFFTKSFFGYEESISEHLDCLSEKKM